MKPLFAPLFLMVICVLYSCEESGIRPVTLNPIEIGGRKLNLFPEAEYATWNQGSFWNYRSVQTHFADFPGDTTTYDTSFFFNTLIGDTLFNGRMYEKVGKNLYRYEDQHYFMVSFNSNYDKGWKELEYLNTHPDDGNTWIDTIHWAESPGGPGTFSVRRFEIKDTIGEMIVNDQKFTDVLKVVQKVKHYFFDSPEYAIPTVVSYYAKGVGLIKEEDAGLVINTAYEFELIDYFIAD